MNKKTILVLFGPTGCGKTMFKKIFISRGWNEIKSYTTREKREDETDEYHFVSHHCWNELFLQEQLVNVNEYHSNHYGILLKDFIKSRPSVMISDISSLSDLQVIAHKHKKNIYFAYCAPPEDLEVLRERHIKRKTEDRYLIALSEIKNITNHSFFKNVNFVLKSVKDATLLRREENEQP